jgi:multidrug transporter EmrE-like cation transporter|tara:strand:- start:2 stop:331 length:330 start_codon:yes stop_codon:yes gene_type:complete
MSPWALIFFAGLLSTGANVLIKHSVNQGLTIFLLINPYFILGLILFGLNLLFFIFALKDLDVSRSYPFLASVSFVSLQAASIFFLGEQISIYALLGIVFIIFGIYLISF